MRVLLVHPSPLMYAEVYLRLEPLGLECVAEALRRAEGGGHEVRLLDLQVYPVEQYGRVVREWRPDAVGFSLNYLANVPEVLDLARWTREKHPGVFIFAGGHWGSFIAEELFAHAAGSLDALVLGEGEVTTPALLAAVPGVEGIAGVATPGRPDPMRVPLMGSLDKIRPARDLTSRRRRYFIGELDPCASVEFSRGCPWDCAFCSAWTFYGRSYRKASPGVAAEEVARIRESNVFVVDDVAFVDAEHGMAIAEALEKRGVRKRYYMETRCDTLIRNEAVFKRWAGLGLAYLFLGFESLDADQLKAFRKRVTPNQNFEALEVARRLGIHVAINLIADPGWGEADFRRAQEWASSVPEVVHLTVATPYPGTELFSKLDQQLASTDYRLFDIQHAVLPTRLPLPEFYEQLVRTQEIINRKFMGWRTAVAVSRILAGQLIRGQTNFLRMLFKFKRVYNAGRQYADHLREVEYHLQQPQVRRREVVELMVHRGKEARVMVNGQ